MALPEEDRQIYCTWGFSGTKSFSEKIILQVKNLLTVGKIMQFAIFGTMGSLPCPITCPINKVQRMQRTNLIFHIIVTIIIKNFLFEQINSQNNST